jgi:hypothetical protein
MKAHERLLRLFLRLFGTGGLLAVFCVFLPYSWMNAAHRALGMGTLPDEPIVGYLARSVSAFYALTGGLLWVLSFDVRRYRLALCYVGGGVIFVGLVLLGVDAVEGMPLPWLLVEGPFTTAAGIAILLLSLRVPCRSE